MPASRRRIRAELPGRTAPDQLRDLVGRAGLGEVVALREVTAEDAEQLELLLRLDTLGDRREVERVAELDDRRHDRLVLRPGVELAHERAVDLDDVDGEVP